MQMHGCAKVSQISISNQLIECQAAERKGKDFKRSPSWKISNQQQRNFSHEMEQVQNDAQSKRGSKDLTLGQAKNTSSSVCETPMPTNSISNSNDLASVSKRKLKKVKHQRHPDVKRSGWKVI